MPKGLLYCPTSPEIYTSLPHSTVLYGTGKGPDFSFVPVPTKPHPRPEKVYQKYRPPEQNSKETFSSTKKTDPVLQNDAKKKQAVQKVKSAPDSRE